MKKAVLFLLFVFGLSCSLRAETAFVAKRWWGERKMLIGADLTGYSRLKNLMAGFRSSQPALMFKEELGYPNTNYFVISGSTQTQEQNDVIERLEARGVITLMDEQVGIVNENGRIMDTHHRNVNVPEDLYKDWAQVEKSTP